MSSVKQSQTLAQTIIHRYISTTNLLPQDLEFVITSMIEALVMKSIHDYVTNINMENLKRMKEEDQRSIVSETVFNIGGREVSVEKVKVWPRR